MSFHTLVIFVLGCLLQILLETTFVDGAVIPQPAGITATNATLGANPTYCNDLEGFVGDGIVQSDCTAAINEFYRTVVQPRGDRKYEFLMEGTDRTSEVPYIVTPNKYTYGTCVIIVVMLETFYPVALPGGHPRHYDKHDIATYFDLVDVALSLSSQCVEGRSRPQAGWSFTGAHDAIGVLLVGRRSAMDRYLRSGAPTAISSNGENTPISLITPSGSSSVANVVGSE